MRAPPRILVLALLALIVTATVGFGMAEAVHLAHNRRYGLLSPVCRVKTDEKVVALTFDDGPDPAYTPDVLALLLRYGDKATFFVIGKHAQAYRWLIDQETSAGMEIGNHTWSHPDLPTLPVADATAEVARTQVLLSDDGAGTARLFRAPLGDVTPAQLARLEKMGLRPVHWSLALDHYVGGMNMVPREAAAALSRDVRPGDIILAHDARAGASDREWAMATLRLLLPALRERGYDVSTVGELLRQGTVVRASPRRWFWESGFTCPRA